MPGPVAEFDPEPFDADVGVEPVLASAVPQDVGVLDDVRGEDRVSVSSPSASVCGPSSASSWTSSTDVWCEPLWPFRAVRVSGRFRPRGESRAGKSRRAAETVTG